MAEQLKLILYLKTMVSDLIFINSIIATELIKVNENLAAQRHGEDFLKKNVSEEHSAISEHLIKIIDKYNKTENELLRKNDLKEHILKQD